MSWQAIFAASILLVLEGLLALPVFAQQAVDLVYHFQPGVVFQITTLKTHDSWSLFELQGNSLNENKAALIRRSFKTLSVDEQGTATFEMSVAFIENEIVQPDGSVKRSDTRNGTQDDAINQLLLHPVLLRVDKKGHILDISGIDEQTMDSFYSKFKPSTKEGRHLIDFLVSAVFSEDIIRQVLPRFIFPEYPQKPAVVGESWSRVESLDLEAFKGDLTLKYTLKAADKSINRWQIVLEETLDNARTKDPQITVELDNFTSKGGYTIVASTGLPESFNLNTDYQLELFQKQPDGSQMPGFTHIASIHSATDTANKISTLREDGLPLNTEGQDFDALFNRGQLAFLQLHYQKAEGLLLAARKKLTKEITLDKQLYLEVCLGAIHSKMEKYEEGDREFQKALQILHDPQIPLKDWEKLLTKQDINYELARLYHRWKRFEQADRLYEEVISFQKANGWAPKSPGILADYAQLKITLKQYVEADILFQQGINLLEERIERTRYRLGLDHPILKELSKLQELQKSLPSHEQ